MPRGDQTGPMGDGAMTGRGAGYCVGNDLPGFANRQFGGGYGRGRGNGRGFNGGGRNRFQNRINRSARMNSRNYDMAGPADRFDVASQQEELNYLKEQAQSLKGTLKNIETQVDKLQQEMRNKNNKPDEIKE